MTNDLHLVTKGLRNRLARIIQAHKSYDWSADMLPKVQTLLWWIQQAERQGSKR